MSAEWFVYIIQASDDSLYTGISTDVDRRFSEHEDVNAGNGVKGARFFRGRVPVAIVYSEDGHDRSSASKREAAIKKMSRSDKLKIVAQVKCLK